jgi:hypothetical protein
MFDISENNKEAVISYLKTNFEDKQNTKPASKNFKNELDSPIKKNNSLACLKRDTQLHTAYPITKIHI